MANNSGTQGMFKKNLYMMDSMTDDELDGKVLYVRVWAVWRAIVLLPLERYKITRPREGEGWRIYFWEACCPVTPLQFLPPTSNRKQWRFLFPSARKVAETGDVRGRGA